VAGGQRNAEPAARGRARNLPLARFRSEFETEPVRGVHAGVIAPEMEVRYENFRLLNATSRRNIHRVDLLLAAEQRGTDESDAAVAASRRPQPHYAMGVIWV